MGRRFSIEISTKSGVLRTFAVYLDGELALKSLAGDLSWSGELGDGPRELMVETHGELGGRYHVEMDLVDEANEMTFIRTLSSEVDRFEQRI